MCVIYEFVSDGHRSSESVLKENLVDEADVDCVLVEMKAEEVLECVSLSGEGCFDPFAH